MTVALEQNDSCLRHRLRDHLHLTKSGEQGANNVSLQRRSGDVQKFTSMAGKDECALYLHECTTSASSQLFLSVPPEIGCNQGDGCRGAGPTLVSTHRPKSETCYTLQSAIYMREVPHLKFVCL